MNNFLLILIIVVALLLVLLIMVQNPKGGGLHSTFGGGGGGSTMGGVQSTNTFLDKSTWTLAIIMTALIMLTNLTLPRHTGVDNETNLPETLDDMEKEPPENTDFPEVPEDENE